MRDVSISSTVSHWLGANLESALVKTLDKNIAPTRVCENWWWGNKTPAKYQSDLSIQKSNLASWSPRSCDLTVRRLISWICWIATKRNQALMPWELLPSLCVHLNSQYFGGWDSGYMYSGLGVDIISQGQQSLWTFARVWGLVQYLIRQFMIRYREISLLQDLCFRFSIALKFDRRQQHRRRSTHLSNLNTILTHWGRVRHICVSQLIIIGSDNGLSPDRRQAIIWTNYGILLFEPLGKNVLTVKHILSRLRDFVVSYDV